MQLYSFTVYLTTILAATTIDRGTTDGGCRLELRTTCRHSLGQLSRYLSSVRADLRGDRCTTSRRVVNALSDSLCTRYAATGGTLSSLPIDRLRLSNTCGFLDRTTSCTGCVSAGSRVSRSSCSGLTLLLACTRGCTSRARGVIRGYTTNNGVARGRILPRNKTSTGISSFSLSFAATRGAFRGCPALLCSNPFTSTILGGRSRVVGGTSHQDHSRYHGVTTHTLKIRSNNIICGGRRDNAVPTCIFSCGLYAVSISGGNKCVICVLGRKGVGAATIARRGTVGVTRGFLSGVKCPSVGDACSTICSGIYAVGFTCRGDNMACCPSLVGINVSLSSNDICSLRTNTCLAGRARHATPSLDGTTTTALDPTTRPVSAGTYLVPGGSNGRIFYVRGRYGGGDAKRRILVCAGTRANGRRSVLLLLCSSGNALAG